MERDKELRDKELKNYTRVYKVYGRLIRVIKKDNIYYLFSESNTFLGHITNIATKNHTRRFACYDGSVYKTLPTAIVSTLVLSRRVLNDKS
jgi:hypothetical protein